MHNTNIWGRLAGKMSSCKIIISSIRTINLPRIYYYIERVLSKWTSVVITNSYAARDEYLNYVNVPSTDFVKVISNGIDLDIFEKRKLASPMEIRSQYNIELEDFVILQLAGISRTKNQLCLLKALRQLENKKIKVLLVGRTIEARYYDNLISYINRNHLENIVFFLGEQQDVFSMLSMADVFVLTSLREGFPNAIMEAMAMGLPIISSDVGDINYLVKNGQNGYLFPKNDHVKLAELLNLFTKINQPQKYQMSKNSKQIIKKYSIKQAVKKTEDVYEQCLSSLLENSFTLRKSK